MKKVVKEEKDEFLYPGDVFVGILGEDCKYKIEDFLKKVIAKARYKNMKLIYNKLYTFLEWKPKGSSMAYEAILEDVVHNGERHLSFVCGFPFLEGKKQKMEITCIQGHKEHNTFKNGWTDVDWLSDAHKVIDPFRTIAMKMTSDNVKKLIKQYQKSVKDNNYKDDDDNLVYMHYNEGKEGKDKFYLILGGTLWRINDENKIYETYDATRNGWSDMAWLGDKLEHEVRCAKHLGQELTHEEMLKKCQDLYETTQKRLKEKNNGGG